MDNTAITLKFDEDEFAWVQEKLAKATAKLSAISIIDLTGVAESVSYGHHLLIDDVGDDLKKISQMLNDSIV
ncbi:hypothetical protein [Sulfuricurvum sp.]|uniref:hypothetical protein n=1 Tax=Sulfuricurvum sp. TaxID=2025608 RepID=UPI00262449FD|nr:hypothetical protein [Sulfuricurvum sp.]MDD3597949.1 hypothetical protein [Sulfuricurvum sp.]